MKDMKNTLMSIVAGVLMTCLLPLAANAQDWQNTNAQQWQTTSVMQGSGSSYSSQVTAVGAVSASEMATTTTTPYSPSKVGPRKSFEDPTDPGITDDNSSPIGDAVLPLLLMAVVFCGAIYFRRKRAAQKS